MSSGAGGTGGSGGGAGPAGGSLSPKAKWIIGAIVIPLVAAVIAALASVLSGSGDETTTTCSGQAQCGNGNSRVER